MAPHKQPDSLYNLAHKSTVSLLQQCCFGIQSRHGSYDSEECIQAVQDLQTMLLSTIPSFMWDNLCEQFLSIFVVEEDLEPDDIAVDVPVFDVQFVALRQIAYALFANEKLTQVKLVSPFMHRQDCVSSLYNQKSSFHFWDKIFKKMHKVTKLVFSVEEYLLEEIDCMWMYDLISDNYCTNLEHIIIPMGLPPDAFNSLLKCTKLRRIAGEDDEDDSLWNVDRESCRRILESLPHLEYLNSEHVVECFTDIEDGHSLKLTHLWLHRIQSTPAYVTLAARICPNLKHLEIFPASVQECLAILNVLADSTINLSSLTVMSYFPSSDNCQRFFSMKGVHLLSLKIEFCYSGLACKLVSLISEYCPNLKRLHIEPSEEYYDEVGPTLLSDTPIEHRSLLPTVLPVFKKLTSLTLQGALGVWDRTFFKWCLFHATNLETLELRNLSRPTLNLQDFDYLFASERFPQLRDANFELSFMSREIIQCVYENCPNLRKLSFECSDENELSIDEYVESIKRYVASNNIDLLVYFTTMEDSFW